MSKRCLPLVLLASLFVQSGFTQSLNYSNNFFITGDYVVGGVGLKGLGDASGYAKGLITIPDITYGPSAGVPDGADVVAAFLYWQTVDFSGSLAGKQGFFRGKPIVGAALGNPATPVSWSSGGCAGSSGGNKTITTYRADVRDYLPIDPNTGRTQVGNSQNPVSYEVRLADSGSQGHTVPFTLGATLVIIYRVLDSSVALNAVIIYDGSYAPSNASPIMTQTMQGFYQPTQLPGSPVAKLTHIVGNGQSRSTDQVWFHDVAITPSGFAAFPGAYGLWDNPTYDVSHYVNPADTSETTKVAGSKCVSWGAVILSMTVPDSDKDGLLDVWKTNQGYCDPTDTSGTCDSTHSSWVDLTGAHTPGTPTATPQDVFIQVDYMCSLVKADGTCATGPGQHSHKPDDQVLANLTSAFSPHGVNLHFRIGNAIQEQTCSDAPPQYCSFPGVPGVVGWKSGFAYLEYGQPLNPSDPTCMNTGVCQRRFQFGRKDSYHYVIFGHALAVPNWRLQDGTLTSITVSSTGLTTFTTAMPHGLNSGDRITITDAITNLILNGIYFVTKISDTAFTIQISNSTGTAVAYDKSTDPNLAVASGNLGTASGFSDVGGANSLITLGLWGADGQTDSTVSGTFMHELGHSLALTHGGSYPVTQGSHALAFEPNCKPNFLSVMNYLFQVDLLGPNGALDYSSQQLSTLDENSLSGGVTTMDGSNVAFTTTKWYDTVKPAVGSAATRHCDGTQLSGTELTTYRYEGPTPPPQNPSSIIPIPWSSSILDTNFDGHIESSLRGYDDWANINLRQIGATGSNFLGGGGAPSVGGGAPSVGGGAPSVGGGAPSVGGGAPSVGGGAPSVGGGVGEITHEAANSIVRTPRNLTDTPTDAPGSHTVTLNWDAPTFGQTAFYNIYRSPSNVAPYFSTSSTATPLARTFTDSAVSNCTTYTYFASAVLLDPTAPGGQRESVGSNSVTYSVPCPPSGLTVPTLTPVTNTVGSVSFSWTAASNASGDIYEYKIYRGIGGAQPTAYDTVLAPGTSYTDTNVNNSPSPGTTYTYFVTAVLVNNDGCTGNSHCRESDGSNSQSILVHWPEMQTITFPALADKTYGNADFAVSATASSGLPVSFSASGTCTVTGATVHIVGAGSCTITASQPGNADWAPAPSVPRSFNIAKANATILVNGYSVTYDGNAHTATGSATGVFNEPLSGLNLSATMHTNAGTYNDAWTFTDVTGNYNNANGVVTDSIAKANAIIVVVPYSVTYDGNAHTATGTATGVKGEALSGFNLSGTMHTNAGTYTDAWTFTDVTGNYNNASGTVTDRIAKANPTTRVIGYNVTEDEKPHTATGTATGVKGESLSGLNLAGTTHTEEGTYTDVWTFTDITGNYNNARGTVIDIIREYED